MPKEVQEFYRGGLSKMFSYNRKEIESFKITEILIFQNLKPRKQDNRRHNCFELLSLHQSQYNLS